MNNIITVFLLLPPLAIFLHYTGGEGHTDMRSTGELECLGTAVVTSLAGHYYYCYSTIIIMADKLVVGWFRLDEDDNNNKK